MTTAFREFLRRGDPAIWLAGSALGICLLMITGMIALILFNGLGFFWPRPLVQVTLRDGEVVLGEVVNREPLPVAMRKNAGDHRIQFKLGNRDITGTDFRWVDESAIVKRETPADAVYIERREYGPFIGAVRNVREGERAIASTPDQAWTALQPLVERGEADRTALRRLELGDVGTVNHAIEGIRLRLRGLELQGAAAESAERTALAGELAELQKEYTRLESQLSQRREAATRTRVMLATAKGEEKDLPTLDIYRAYRANELTTLGRARIYASRLWEFVSGLAGGGTTVIFSTHDIQEAERYGQRLLVLADGEALFDGPAGRLREAVRREAPEAADKDFETAFVSYLHHRGH